VFLLRGICDYDSYFCGHHSCTTKATLIVDIF
jgi:hypothetical protein